MSGFSCHHDQSDNASFLHNYNFLHAPCSMQKDDTNIHSNYSPVWPRTNECFQELPLHFQLKEAIDATAGKHGDEFPSSAGFCGFSESIDDRNAADLGETTQMPKRRKKINSKVASRQTDEQRMKASKMEKEQSSGTQEIGYVYVRARRGQATDSHSLAERVRREKIGERMKLLQSLVPGCAKIAGKAQLLDEIINYVHSLQTQVQILVGKLSILSPYVSGYNESNQGNATESICRLEASLSSMMMESSCNLMHSADDSQHNSLVSASSSSLTSQGDQKHFISQGVEVPMWEIDVQEHIGALDQCWLDHLAQQE